MARYVNWDKVVSRYKRISDMVSGEDEAENIYIKYAEAYVDANLGSAFAIPFSSNNDTVVDLTIDVAFAKSQMFKDPEKAKAIMTHVNSQICALKDGSMVMVVGSGATVSMAGEPVYSQTQDYTRVFGKGNVIDFVVDSSQLWDEENERE